MQTLVGILCFMGLQSFDVDWEAPEAPSKYWKMNHQPNALRGMKRSVNPSKRGGVYQRPIGNCTADLSNCTCTPPARPEISLDTDTGKVAAVLCTVDCAEASDCPKPPVLRYVQCQHFEGCLIYCNQDEDCPGPDGICELINLRVGSACMYKP
ncbi:hypothetical protein FOZ63_007551 [Perkinsus olseni]|uniref:Uncharacterized protein n=1 Tax=Perkinsus olseni TaxID=32597 RepID=A0A7J6R9H5_PEROL|nr:hypothetical protein FOZ62_013414 [Perkinsus olseni]KAF4717294.1 hypothetical protein FOZ63_007551 [Perkinsus olseni]